METVRRWARLVTAGVCWGSRMPILVWVACARPPRDKVMKMGARLTDVDAWGRAGEEQETTEETRLEDGRGRRTGKRESLEL